MSIPKERGVVVATELTVVAHAALKAQVEADLEIEDPEDAVAHAILKDAEPNAS
tara:strand:- start:299 stop:460 length:162 start_codon:yes stop_codon:yes gene_type:complete